MANQPTAASVHIDQALTNMSLAYIQSADAFIANKVFPTMSVDKQSGKYFTYTKNDWFRDEAQLRGPASVSAGSGYNVSNAGYSCDVWAIHKDVPDQIAQNSDAPINAEMDAARFVTQRMLLRHEIEWAASFFASSIWATDSTPGVLWSTLATSDPVTDVEVAKKTVLASTGFLPNTMVLGYDVYSVLLNHPDIIDRMKYTTSDNVTQGILARFFGVDNLYVAQTVKATNIEGETAATSFVHGKHALVCYVDPNPGPLMPTAGLTFAWNGVSDGAGANVGVSRFYLPELRAWRIESQMAWDSKVVATDLGYFLASVVS